MIYQVFYDKKQLSLLEEEFIAYYNPMCSVYFENQVIVDLNKDVNILSTPYFGVVSWNLRQKIERMKSMRVPFRNILNSVSNPVDLVWKKMEDGIDIIPFMQTEQHNPILAANEIHPEFKSIWIDLMMLLKLHPQINEWKRVIYCNAFVAKSDLYHRYIHELLIPAMYVMNGELNSIVMQDSKYPKFFPPELSDQTGIGHWTYHTFICERLFSYWLNFMK